MNNTEKIAMIEDLLELDEGSLTEDTQLDSIPEYDSMAKLALIVMFSDEFDKKITGEQIKGLKTVADILSLMES